MFGSVFVFSLSSFLTGSEGGEAQPGQGRGHLTQHLPFFAFTSPNFRLISSVPRTKLLIHTAVRERSLTSTSILVSSVNVR